ncbi:SNF2 Helicase protein [Prauserella flava]|nr:SNF2 Helicase protein [Prauserella flava]MCR3734810.1 SNF2 Helicase protein [Prauserella salsuginis]
MAQEVPSWLRRWMVGGGVGTHGLREVLRRLEAQELTPKDIRALLLVRLDGPDGDGIRQRVLEHLQARPHVAVSVLSVHAQMAGLPVPTVDPEPINGRGGLAFRGQAVLELEDGSISGETCVATSKSAVRHAASLSLLNRLVDGRLILNEDTTVAGEGILEPGEPVAAPGGGESSCHWSSMTPHEFLGALTECARLPNPDPQLVGHTLQRARAGLLDDKQLAVVLFRARSAAWDEVRREGVHAATRIPVMLPYVLNQYAALTGVSTGQYGEGIGPDGTKWASFRIIVDGRMRTFGPCYAPGKAARQAVRLEAVSELAGLDPSAGWPDTAVGDSEWLAVTGAATAISVLDVARSRGWISSPQWRDGKATAGISQAWVSCQHDGDTVGATAKGGNRKQARQAAAGALILLLNERARPATAVPAIAVPSSNKGTEPVAEPDSTSVSPLATVPAAPEPRAPQPSSESASSTEPPSAPERPAVVGTSATRDRLPSLDRDTLMTELDDGAYFVFDTTVPTVEAGLLCALSDHVQAAPETTVRRILVGRQGESFSFRCGRISTGDAIALLAGPARERWHDSARVWTRVIHLALDAIARHGIAPALADTNRRGARYPTWRVGAFDADQAELVNQLAGQLEDSPYILGDWARGENVRESVDLVRAVRGMIDAVADYLVSSSGRGHLHGPVPFTGAAYVYDADRISTVQRWVDDAADSDDLDSEAPSLQLTVLPPRPDTAVLEATLQLCRVPGSADTAVDADEVWWDGTVLARFPNGPDLRERVRRRLRLAGRTLPSLEALGADPYPARCWLSAADAALLRGSAADTLTGLGVEVVWDKDWADALSVEAVIEPAESTSPLTGRLGLGELFDRRWRITADGQILNPAELDQLRRAELPWIMRRNRWVMIDDKTQECLRQPKATTIPRAQAMLDVFDGWVTINGRAYACTPADGLAALIGDLRSTDYAEAVRQVSTECSMTLMPHQARAVAWMLRMSQAGFGCLLADDMGLGKTISALAFHQSPRRTGANRPTLVICPSGKLIGQWERDAARFAGLPVIRYWKQKRSLAGLTPATVVVTTYPTLQSSIDELSAVEWGLVVADEAQRTKNGATGAARWIRALPSAMRVALTGTPYENQAGELRTILDWCNPGLFGTPAEFTAQFVRPITDAADERQAAWAHQRIQRILRPFILRRLKDDPALGMNLPGKHETTHLVHLSDRQRGMLEALTADDVEQITRNPNSPAVGQLAKKVIHDQRKITNSPAQYDDLPVEELGLPPHELEDSTPKLTVLRRLVERLRGTGERALVFTHYVYAAKMVHYFLTRLGYTSSLYIGDVGESDREDRIEAFTSGGTQILVATVTTGGVGLDLHCANHVIHFERHWNPAVEAQATDRAYRIGQTRIVNVDYLVTRNSIEDRISALLAAKRDLSNLYLPGGEFDFTKLTAAELVHLVKLRTS